MAKVFYAVTATFPTKDIADEYIGWLEGGHVRDVMNCGATGASIVWLDPADGGDDSPRVETQYTFPSRAVFEHYEREDAPSLRQIGKDRFGGRGVTFERRSGEVAFGSR